MIPGRFAPLVLKQIVRQRVRSLLTITGLAVAMFLFTAVQAAQSGVREATQATAADTMLIVYRKDRFCPFASRMPQSYARQIERIPGVRSVVPVQILVNNCRTSLDVVTFRGVPHDAFEETFLPDLEIVAGSLDEWRRRSDAALIGERLAQRRGLSVGDRFDAAGVTVYVAGIVRSDQPQHQNVAYVLLDFLQYGAGSRAGGTVTQFNVKVDNPQRLGEVAQAIDADLATAQEPTRTSGEKAFVAQAAADVVELVGFVSWLGWGCLAAVLALVGNAIVLSVQDRIRDHAILQTLGYRGHQIARLILSEGLLLSLAGAALGCGAALLILWRSALAISVDGLNIPIHADPAAFAVGVGLAAALGVLASLAPAVQAGRRSIVACFRAA
ncbi:MAG TPA: ABC transporter permease [Phycisphaerae bacterium]|nr:ABC transporter permease [Phycisphaerae bacterium]